MGMVFGEVAFDRRVPDLSRIADKITELSGLPVSATKSGVDVIDDLYDMHTRVAFTCAPEEQLELHTYLPGAVGMSEPTETQTVYLRSYIGQDLTLMAVSILALEALGGRPRHPISEERKREYGTPITASQLAERHRKLRKQARRGAAIVLLLLPVLLPLWFVGFLGFLVTMPWRIWKAYQLYRS